MEKKLFEVELLKSETQSANGGLPVAAVKITADDIEAALSRGKELCREHGYLYVVKVEQIGVVEVV